MDDCNLRSRNKSNKFWPPFHNCKVVSTSSRVIKKAGRMTRQCEVSKSREIEPKSSPTLHIFRPPTRCKVIFLQITIPTTSDKVGTWVLNMHQEEKIFSMVIDFVHKNVYRIRFQEIKIGSLEGFEKRHFSHFTSWENDFSVVKSGFSRRPFVPSATLRPARTEFFGGAQTLDFSQKIRF